MRNESPVGLATYLGLLPVVAAAVIFIILIIINGGDVDAAHTATLGIIAALSSVVTAALRQWRAVKQVEVGGGADPSELEGGNPLPTGAGLEGIR